MSNRHLRTVKKGMVLAVSQGGLYKRVWGSTGRIKWDKLGSLGCSCRAEEVNSSSLGGNYFMNISRAGLDWTKV